MSDQKNAVPANAPAQKIVTELKVSGNVMTLDAGLFCIFNAPGSPIPDAGTGLPGVRVSVPPGPVFRPDAVTITSFRDDGWLGGWNGAALVRVTRGPAQIMVTIYQAPNTTAEPPRLQVMRLADASGLPPLGVRPAQAAPPAIVQALQAPAAAPAAPAPPPAAANVQNTPAAASQDTVQPGKTAEIVAHLQVRGDVAVKLGDWMGEPGSKHWIEGFAVSPKGPVGPGDIEYQAVLGRGWLSPWAEGGQYCGSRGMSLPILGLRMRLRGEAADRYDCVVEASFVDGTRVGPLDNGEPCQADSMAPLEAFRITVVAHDSAEAHAEPAAPAPKPKKAAAVKPAAAKPAAAKPAPVAAKPAPAPAKPAKRKK